MVLTWNLEFKTTDREESCLNPFLPLEKNNTCETNELMSPYLKKREKKPFKFPKLRRAVAKITSFHLSEKGILMRTMQGKDKSVVAGFQWFVEPDSWKYTVLRYSRAVCIFANFIIIPVL
jgi:hypothetical protein